LQAREKVRLLHLDQSELLKVRIVELCVQQFIAARDKPRDEMYESDLRRICCAGEHALAKECRAKRYPVQAAHQFPFIIPALNRVGIAALVE
tara:strand:- start:565 stop:840 length:276 start_codon:yes stop_codon:yes gene_type:complete